MIERATLARGEHVSMYPWMIAACDGDVTSALVLGHMIFRTYNGERWHVATAEDVCEHTGLTLKQVRRALTVLRELGHIQSRRADKWNPTLEWNLVLDAGEHVVSPEGHHGNTLEGQHTDTLEGHLLEDEEEGQEEDQSPAPATPERLMMFTDIRSDPPSLAVVEPSDDEQFAEFWKVYPRKTAKAEARKKLKVALRKVPLARILAAVEEQRATTWAGKEVQYIPHAATWLNQQRWEDVPEKPARTKPKGEKYLLTRQGEWYKNPEWADDTDTRSKRERRASPW